MGSADSMELVDLGRLERQARRAYEWGRLRRAIFGLAPVLTLTAFLVWVGGNPELTAPFALAAFGAGVIALWYGREPKRAVIPGLAAGLIPVVLTLGSMHLGHFCFGDRCTSVCLAACVAGGVSAGVVVAIMAGRKGYGWRFWVAGSVLSLLVGSLGCACLGYAGMAGMAIGYGVGLVPGIITKVARRS